MAKQPRLGCGKTRPRRRAARPSLARPYTAADDLALRTGAARGDTALVVAQQIGRTRSSILGRAAKLGVHFAGVRK